MFSKFWLFSLSLTVFVFYNILARSELPNNLDSFASLFCVFLLINGAFLFEDSSFSFENSSYTFSLFSSSASILLILKRLESTELNLLLKWHGEASASSVQTSH